MKPLLRPRKNTLRMTIDGVLNLNKPHGITSRQALDRIRKLWDVKKAGHGGTLDPDATGVLLICLGKATKLFDLLQEGTKSYSATITLGITTDTFDASGRILTTSPTEHISEDRIKFVLKSFVGKIDQTVPMFSAIKYKGKPLYKIARQGKQIENLPSKQVTIKSIEITLINPPEVEFKVDCSKGTYVRSLVNDVGRKLECGAILSQLVRTRSGIFKLEDAYDLDSLEKREITPNESVVPMNAVIEALT